MLVAKGWSLSVTKYRSVLSIKLHYEAQFLIVFLTHSLRNSFRTCHSFSARVLNLVFVLLDSILNATRKSFPSSSSPDIF